eukprot:PhF_6_TR14899/c0_g1_i1/m.23247
MGSSLIRLSLGVSTLIVIVAVLKLQGALTTNQIQTHPTRSPTHQIRTNPPTTRDPEEMDSTTTSVSPPPPPPKPQHHITTTDLPPKCVNLGTTFSAYLTGYIQQHSSHNRKGRRVGPRLVYNCQSNKFRQWCGGMGDRFRGMISVFFLALVTNRTFELFHPVPVALEEMLEPRNYDWRTTEESLQNVPVDGGLMRLQGHKAFVYSLSQKLNNPNAPDLRVRSNSFSVDPYVHSNAAMRKASVAMGITASCNITCYFGCLYDVLFKPTKEFQSLVDEHVDGKRPYISLQVRVGGDWATGLHIKEPYRTHPATLHHYWSVLKELLALPKYRGAHIFVSSDSALFVNKTVEQFGEDRVIYVKGDAYQHVDTLNLHDMRPEKYTRIPADIIRGTYVRTLLSHYLLSEGAHVVMAQSGFGDTAFWRGHQTATALFMDMNDMKTRTIWMHHLEYSKGNGQSVQATKNRIFSGNVAAKPFY